jgi:hypothetical protein
MATMCIDSLSFVGVLVIFKWTRTSLVFYNLMVCRLKALADSTTEASFDTNWQELTGSDIWTSRPAVQSWFENKWMPEKKASVLVVCACCFCSPL